jgi:hypothetical protein
MNKRFILLAALLFVAFGNTFAAEGVLASDDTASEQQMVEQCTASGTEMGLSGDELDAYVENCVENLKTEKGAESS